MSFQDPRPLRPLRPLRPSRLPLLAVLLAACASDPEDGAPPPLERFPNVELKRPGFRLIHPENWSVDDEVPGHDPDHFFFLAGPDGATVAFMVLDEPAEPAQLAATMARDHGLRDPRETPFPTWGRYTGAGVDVRGENEAGVPAGMRIFAWSGAERSFLVAESYVDYGYAAARAGFEAIELSFALTGEEERWPAVALGTPLAESGERLLVRAGFELRFPGDWKVDADAPGYDPDRFFTLVTPYASSWMVVQLLEGDLDAAVVLEEARAGLAPILETARSEETFESWGRLAGRGVELKGDVGGLAATLRIFAHAAPGRALLVTEFYYDELADELEPGFRRVASSFELRG
jgi:hypothetical protein